VRRIVMQLKPAVLFRTVTKSRRRLLVGAGVLVALIALAIALTFTLAPSSSDVTAGLVGNTAIFDSNSGGLATGNTAGASDPYGNLVDYQTSSDVLRGMQGLPIQGAHATAAGSAAPADSTAPEESSLAAEPMSITVSGEPDYANDPASAEDTTTTTTEASATTSSTSGGGTTTKITQSSTTNEALSWAELRGVPPSTSTTLQTVAGYEVLDITGVIGNPAIDTYAPGGLDVFVWTPGFIWWSVGWLGGIWPAGELPTKDSEIGDGSWKGGKDGAEEAKVTMAPNSGPASVASGSYIDVFVRGEDNALYHRRGTTTWTGWEYLGGYLSSDPAVASRAPGKLDVFARGPFDQLWHLSYDGKTWSNWEPLGGDLESEPAAVSRDSGHIDVFVRGTDDALWHLAWSDSTGWSSWESLGGVLTSGPAVASGFSGRMDVFARGEGNTLWQTTWRYDRWLRSFRWEAWQDLGGSPFASSPDAVAWDQDRIDVVVRGTNFQDGTDTALWHRYWNGVKWLP
jgi:3D (Asp-Asp-Asp) domain-containing protein